MVERKFPRGTSNQKRYQDLGSAHHQYGISAFATQTSFCEGSSGDLAKRRLFSQAITPLTPNVNKFMNGTVTPKISSTDWSHLVQHLKLVINQQLAFELSHLGTLSSDSKVTITLCKISLHDHQLQDILLSSFYLKGHAGIFCFHSILSLRLSLMTSSFYPGRSKTVFHIVYFPAKTTFEATNQAGTPRTVIPRLLKKR